VWGTRFLSQEAVVAAIAIEVSTESSLGPVLQMFSFLPLAIFLTICKSEILEIL